MNEKISYEDVMSISEQIEGITENIKDNFDRINKSFTDLASGISWSGPSASNFLSKFHELSKNFDEVYDELKNSVNYLQNAVSQYQTTDSKDTTAAKGITNG